jgi:DNA polymerase
MRASTLDNLLEDKTLLAPVRDAIQIRLDLSRSSVAKFDQLLGKTDPTTSRLYDTTQYYGARTGRWAGRGVQLHNLPRGMIFGNTPDEVLNQMKALWTLISLGDWRMIAQLYGNVGKVLSSTVRPTLCAEPGKVFVVSDFSSIETAVIAWLAGCERLLQLFHDGRDPYKDFASELLGIPYDVVSKKDRNYAKPAVLGAVFMLGAKGYQAYAQQFGQSVELSEATRIIDKFRSIYPEIPRFWEDLKSACHHVVKGHAGLRLLAGDHITFHKKDEKFLFAELPSGRSLAYPLPTVSTEETEWGQREQFSYMAEKEFAWVRTYSHPGKLAENVTQAVARDLLANSLIRLDQYGYEVVLHVHDEVVVQVDAAQARVCKDAIETFMQQNPRWAKDIPVGTEAFITPRYIKL